MGEISEHRCTVSRKDRFLLYVSCTTTLILVGAFFCLFALHQIRIDRLESRINNMEDTRAKFDFVEENANDHAPDHDSLHRYARRAVSQNVDDTGSVDKLLEQMISLQVKNQ